MSIIMDRVNDLQAVNWQALPISTLNEWECEALNHVKECRCQKCALLFARLDPASFRQVKACAIACDIILELRRQLERFGKL